MVLRLDVKDDDEYGQVAAHITANPHVVDWYCSTTSKAMQDAFRKYGGNIKRTKVRLREAAVHIGTKRPW
jgi:hypothetical protein